MRLIWAYLLLISPFLTFCLFTSTTFCTCDAHKYASNALCAFRIFSGEVLWMDSSRLTAMRRPISFRWRFGCGAGQARRLQTQAARIDRPDTFHPLVPDTDVMRMQIGGRVAMPRNQQYLFAQTIAPGRTGIADSGALR